ncbi:EexN family lipoprotein, partial [Paracidovorax cattleyae]
MHKTPVAIPLLAMLLAGCSPSQPAETVDSLVANPERLKELRRQCREEREKVSDALCEKAAQAFNRR